MIVLGLGTEGESGAAIVEDGRILAAINEERISRLKLVAGFPRDSVREVLRLSGTSVEDLDAVLIGGREDRLQEELKPFDGWFEDWKDGGFAGRIKRLGGRFSRYRRYLPVLEDAYYLLLTPAFRKRRQRLAEILHEDFDVSRPIEFVDHHFCHVTSAYFTSSFDDALVVSLDGGGDARSGLIYSARDGRLEFVKEYSAFNSLGNYYAYVTHICGYKAHKHEGKITGLAAYGEPRYLDLLREMIDEKDGEITNHAGLVFGPAIDNIRQRLPDGWKKEDLAASIQQHFENVVVGVVSHWVEKTGHRNVALAGGVCANVRINQEVHRIPGVERVFVHPAMTDGGLAGGAALAACVPGTLPETMPASRAPLPHVYLGTELTDDEIAAALEQHGLESETYTGPVEKRIAELLAEGHVVARANGAMEYGPRALGNRSILYQPTDRSVNDWLNDRLRRTEFMPFAPAVMMEHADRCFDDLAGARHPAEFMTITFYCTPWMKKHMKGVVHLDGTARPQLVRRDRNASFHAIIEAFYALTGLPAIINTSFNMHEEPIVRTADDCVRAFLEGNLDVLAIGSSIVHHPAGVTHELKPVDRVDAGETPDEAIESDEAAQTSTHGRTA